MIKLSLVVPIGLGFLAAGATAATSFPTRPITLIVPFPAGGPSDSVARIVADRMPTSLGQPVIVENVSGAGGTIGRARVANSEPDGYTLVIGNWASHVGATATFKVSYDVVNDFEPVAMLASLCRATELAEASRLFDLSEHRLRSPCRIPATNCETLAGFSPQSAKPKSFAAK
jgi:tripartite-type tricarboxylate transporter receptor subunit TctC